MSNINPRHPINSDANHHQETRANFRIAKEEIDALQDDYWDDLRFPATAINPPGAASDPDIDPDDGTLLFDPNAVELIFCQVQMPHAWKQGSDIKPHVHWTKTTSAAGLVAWKCEYQLAAIGETFPGTWTSLGVVNTPAVADEDTADQHLLTPLGTIDMSAVTGVSAMLKIKLSRIGNDATNDTYAADAKLLELDIHFQTDGRGSIGEYTK